MKSRFSISDTPEAALCESSATPFHAYAQRVHLDRLLQVVLHKRQRFFEFLTGLQGEKSDWDVHVTCGGLHGLQVGEGSSRQVLVEEMRFWPFQGLAARGKAPVWQAWQQEEQKASNVISKSASRLMSASKAPSSISSRGVQDAFRRRFSFNCNGFLDSSMEDLDHRQGPSRFGPEKSSRGVAPELKGDVAVEVDAEGAFSHYRAFLPRSSARTFMARPLDWQEELPPDPREGAPSGPTVEMSLRMLPKPWIEGGWIDRESARWRDAIYRMETEPLASGERRSRPPAPLSASPGFGRKRHLLVSTAHTRMPLSL